MKGVIKRIYYRLIKNKVLQAIQNGFTMLYPIILIGSFAVLLNSFPLSWYQDFLSSFDDGIIQTFLAFILNGTFGIFSIYITIAVSISYSQLLMGKDYNWLGSVFTSVACFMIMTPFRFGLIIGDITSTGMFTAIVCALLAPKLYCFVQKKLGQKRRLYTDGGSLAFHPTFSTFLPVLIVMLIFSTINYFIDQCFHVTNLLDLFSNCMNFIFEQLGNNIGSGFLYVFLSSITWCFGIHGTNVLEDVAKNHFPSNCLCTQSHIHNPIQSEILTRPFFNHFVSIGGCGATLCLILAILLFSKRRGNRNLSKVSLVPGIFNINELPIFGLPMILNPILCIPFILTPLILFCTSYLFMCFGFVPTPTVSIEWTTPPIISGYLATNSIRGSILQGINIFIGIGIYAPFIRLLDKNKDSCAKQNYDDLVTLFKEAETSNKPVTLLDFPGNTGKIAKTLALDLQTALHQNQLVLYYQPQFNNTNTCIGAEALLRWNHPAFGMIYPPLIIKLAQEVSILQELEEYIFTLAATDYHTIYQVTNTMDKISVNISVTTLLKTEFKSFLQQLMTQYRLPHHSLCIEITEQTELMVNDKVDDCLNEIKEMGFLFALDDFSMGHTSLKYLLGGQFDIVKLDGSLVRGLLLNQRCKSIIDSIIHLSYSLKFDIIAEYVETDTQQKELEIIGCNNYQGYLYSPAIPSEQYIQLIINQEKKGNAK